LMFRRHERDVLVGAADALAKAGIMVLGLAVTTVILLVFDVVPGFSWALMATAGMAVFFLTTWLLLPLALLRRQRSRHD
jgi:predicted RND superfamily exporter protein